MPSLPVHERWTGVTPYVHDPGATDVSLHDVVVTVPLHVPPTELSAPLVVE